MKNIKKYLLETFQIALLILLLLSPVQAANDQLPEPMVGQTKLVEYAKTSNTHLNFNSVNSSVNLGNPDKIKNISGSMTVEFWYTYNGPGSDPGNYGWYGVLNKNSGGSGYYDPFLFFVGPGANNTHSMNIRTAAGTVGSERQLGVLNISNNNFHQAAYVFDQATLTVKLFVDGVLGDSTSVPSGWKPWMNDPNNIYTYNLGIGYWSAAYFNGKFDELRIYDRSLSDDEIAQGYLSNTYDNGSSLKGYWNFNSNLEDSSANPAPTGTRTSSVTFDSTQYGPTKTYYGGFTGNEAVMNYTLSGKTAGRILDGSAVFNGTSSYVDAGQAPDITGTGAFAISVWAKRTRTASVPRQDVIISQALDYFGDYRIYFTPNDWSGEGESPGQIAFRVTGTGTGPGQDAGQSMKITSGSKTYAYNDNIWHHIVAIRSADGMTGSLWVDGENVTTVVSTSPYPIGMRDTCPMGTGCTGGTGIEKTLVGQLGWDNSAYMMTGGHSYSDGRGFFGGNISTVRTYNRSLGSTEINGLYHEASVPTDTKLYLKLDDNSTAIKDYSSNNYSGITFYNGTWSDDGVTVTSIADAEGGLLGFDSTTLTSTGLGGCLNGILFNSTLSRCFISNSATSSIKVMTSRTLVGDTPITETAALLYSPATTIVGDAYLGSSDPNNFAYWGRNLTQSGSGTAASQEPYWGMNNYTINTDSRASLNANGAEYKQYKAKIDTLTGEAVSSGSVAYNDLNLQRSDITNGASTDESAKYPEGKIWKIASYTNNYHCGNGTLLGACAITYHGKGTIILPKAYVAAYGSDSQMYIYKDIKPASNDSNARLGYITDRNINISDNVTVQAAIFTTGTITIGNNVTMIGSFVASNFNITGSNVRFFYDKGLATSQPPGFQTLKMPHPAEN